LGLERVETIKRNGSWISWMIMKKLFLEILKIIKYKFPCLRNLKESVFPHKQIFMGYSTKRNNILTKKVQEFKHNYKLWTTP